MKREITALVGIPVILGILLFGPPWAFQILVGIVALAAVSEACRMGGRSAAGAWISLVPGALWIVAIVRNEWMSAALCATIFLPPMAALLMRGTLAHRHAGLRATLEAVVIIAVPAGYMASLRGSFGNREGIYLILFLLAVVWISDSSAYYVGKHFGKRRIAPAVSPNKTVAGTTALMVSSIVMTTVVSRALEPPPPLPYALAGGFALGVAAFFGDLVQSLAKRVAGVKDSGSFFPGHGGFWDRTDSLFWTAVPLYYLVLWR